MPAVPHDTVDWSLRGLKVSGDDPAVTIKHILWGIAVDPRFGIGWLESEVRGIHAELTAMAEDDDR
jgi:hypothetical protein